MSAFDFCIRCGSRTESRVPEDDDRPRDVCTGCGRIHYVNPKLVVGCVPEWEERILLCAHLARGSVRDLVAGVANSDTRLFRYRVEYGAANPVAAFLISDMLLHGVDEYVDETAYMGV